MRILIPKLILINNDCENVWAYQSEEKELYELGGVSKFSLVLDILILVEKIIIDSTNFST